MNRTLFTIAALIIVLAGCRNSNSPKKRIAVAKAGASILYYDEIPSLIQPGTTKSDSAATLQNYINSWAKRKLLLLKAEQNLTPQFMAEVSKQMEETRENLLIYQYERQMLLEKMDTVLTDSDLENYYSKNEKAFMLTSNIVKALFIKIPSETPDLQKIRNLVRSTNQRDLQQLESLCFQYAEKFDDFKESWVPMDRITTELPEDIEDQENFLKKKTFYETNDANSVYFLLIREYRLRNTIAPYDYVKNDIKRIVWNMRRIELIQSIENGLFNDAVKENTFKIYR